MRLSPFVVIAALPLGAAHASSPCAQQWTFFGTITDAGVFDTIPAGSTFLSASAGGKATAGQVTWNLGTIAPKAAKQVTVALTRREKETKSFYIPILWDYEREGGRSEMSILLGLFGYTRTAVAARYRVLWFITFSRGDADRLVETTGESDS